MLLYGRAWALYTFFMAARDSIHDVAYYLLLAEWLHNGEYPNSQHLQKDLFRVLVELSANTRGAWACVEISVSPICADIFLVIRTHASRLSEQPTF